jgi:TPR repeat protein
MNNLGVMYEHGQGVSRDPSKPTRGTACGSPSPQALRDRSGNLLDRVASQLSLIEIARAQQLHGRRSGLNKRGY